MKKRNVAILMACAIVLFFAAIDCAWAVRGVTDTEIRIGQWGPQTGPAALWGAVARGSGLFFKLINEEGGIHGRKIKYFLRDDAYQPPKTVAIAKELVEDKEVFAFASGVGTATGMALKKYLHKHEVPWVGPAAGSPYWAYPPSKYLFGVFPLYCDEASILVNYAVKELGKKRIAVFYLNDDYGKVGLVGTQIALEKLGMKLEEAVSVEALDTDLSSHCMKLKKSNADCVLIWSIPKHGAMIIMQGAKMGFRPQWMVSSTLSDTNAMYKLSKGLFKDVLFASFGELPDSKHHLMRKYREAQKRLEPKARWEIFYYAGILFIEPMVEALKICGRDLTADNFVRAMESLKDFQGIGPKLTFGPNQRQGTRAFFLGKCGERGKAIRISDWITSDIDVQEVLSRLKQ